MDLSEKDQWALAAITDEDGRTVGTLIVDIANPPDNQKTWRVYITFPYVGRPLPTSVEMDQFERVDWQIRELCKKLNGRNVAIWTRDGVRDWIVYIEDPEVFQKLAGILFKNWAQIEATPDRTWSQLHTLRGMVKK